jgi:hypothetical protein
MLQPRTKLQKAILHQVGDKDYIRDIYEHGADAGYPGLTYYSDTVKFFQKHRAEIVQLVQDTAAAFGQGAVEFIKSFRCLNGKLQRRQRRSRNRPRPIWPLRTR